MHIAIINALLKTHKYILRLKAKRLPHMEQAFPFSIASVVQDFDPVAVGIVDEIEVHRAVFKADAAHFFV